MRNVFVIVLAVFVSLSSIAQNDQKHDTVDLNALENLPAKPWSAKTDNTAGGFFMGAGVASFSHILGGASGGVLENASAENSTAILFQIGYLLKGNYNSKFSVYGSLGYSNLHTTGAAVSILYRRTIYVNNHYLEFKTLPSYNINFSGGGHLALGAGINFMTQASGKSYIHNDNSAGGFDDVANPKFKKVFACPVGEISYHGKKIILSIHYQQSGNAVEYANEFWSVHRLAGGISYKF